MWDCLVNIKFLKGCTNKVVHSSTFVLFVGPLTQTIPPSRGIFLSTEWKCEVLTVEFISCFAESNQFFLASTAINNNYDKWPLRIGKSRYTFTGPPQKLFFQHRLDIV